MNRNESGPTKVGHEEPFGIVWTVVGDVKEIENEWYSTTELLQSIINQLDVGRGELAIGVALKDRFG